LVFETVGKPTASLQHYTHGIAWQNGRTDRAYLVQERITNAGEGKGKKKEKKKKKGGKWCARVTADSIGRSTGLTMKKSACQVEGDEEDQIGQVQRGRTSSDLLGKGRFSMCAATKLTLD
jgi:hypothetical protein